MKLHQLFEASRGEQVVQFADYLDKGFISKKHREDFEKLGTELFRLGFESSPGNPHFFKKTEGNKQHLGWIVMFPSMKKTRIPMHSSSVEVLYSGLMQPHDILVSGRDTLLVKDFVTDVEEELEHVKQKTLTRSKSPT